MIENIRLAFKGIWSHKMRSFLTMLGIIIGIASIISIVSTIKGTNEQIKQNLIGAGNNNVDIKLTQGEGDYYMDQGNPDGIMVTTDEIKEKIKNIDGVVNATFYNSRKWGSKVLYKDTNIDSASMYGADSDFFKTKGYVIDNGRNFTIEDKKNNSKVAILDEYAVKALFAEESAVGKTIDINGEPFTIIGTAKKSEEFKPVIENLKDYYMYYSDTDGMIVIPDVTWPILYKYDEPSNVSIMAESTEKMSSVGKKVEDVMNELVISEKGGNEKESDGAKISYKAADLLKTVQNLQRVSESTNKQLLWIASISLLVGGIGVMNIMLVSVTERTREIGLKKAIGARKKKILKQFLTEAAVLTCTGGIIGVIVGIILSQVISKISQTPASISPGASLLAVLFSMIIGIVFGFLPSYKAANLNPIDALRYE